MKIQLLTLFISLSILQAQTFQEFQQEQNRAFKNYQDQMDVDFVSYLKSQWSYVHGKPPSDLYQKKKPTKLPVKKEQAAPKRKKLTIDAEKTVVTKPVAAVKNKPVMVVKIAPDRRYKYKEISYYGLNLKIAVDKNLPTSFSPIKSSKDISRFWDKISRYDFSETLKNLEQYQKIYHLNGWSMYEMTAKLSQQLYTKAYEQKLFSWFLLNKLSYKVKIAYTKSQVVLLSATQGPLYATPFIRMNGQRYYALDFYLKGKIGSLYTYKKDFPLSHKRIDFSLKTLPLLPYKAVEREVVFKDQDLKFTLKLNAHLLDYMSHYPQVDYRVYFESMPEREVEQVIIDKFSPLLKGKSRSEALDILLHFVQKSFAYETDDEQFGHEKVMFAMETFFYPYSDCDDRAVLFAYLAERLLGVKVVGLKLSDHMATAIHVRKIAKDLDYLQVDSFIVADPTYINANLGRAMPQYINKRAEIITTDKTRTFITVEKQAIVKK